MKTENSVFGASVPKYAKWPIACNENWNKVSYMQSRPPNSDTLTKAKHCKESEYWLNQPDTSSRLAVLQEESKEQQKTNH
jgi:hypothetical protein